MAYLYGASIQGIQGYIFETNRLKEIVGASNLIEYFCSIGFLNGFFMNIKKTVNVNILRKAGGNIRLLFEDTDQDTQDTLKMLVEKFPKYLMQKAYGITISQAVVVFDSEKDDYLKKIDELEEKLINDRNISAYPFDPKLSIIKQAPRTGKPLYETKKINSDKIVFDKASWQKYSEAEEGHNNILEKLIDKDLYKKFPLDMEKISNNKSKVALIHADGNKMGLLLQQMKKELEGEKSVDIQKAYKEISKQIEKATKDAVKEAYEVAFGGYKDIIPFRPIVIGGDDITMICNANEALLFTNTYLKKFEENTKEYFKVIVEIYNLEKFKDGLTACAGIAYCNEKFPFHYAADVAEALCSYAKKASDREKSCLMFHNIQSSYFTDYATYEKEELLIKKLIDKKEKSDDVTSGKKELTTYDISLQFGPYYIKDIPTIEALINLQVMLQESEIPIGKIREWLSELHRNKEYAELKLQRFNDVLKKGEREKLSSALKALNESLSSSNFIVNKKIIANEEETPIKKTPIHDLMQLKNVYDGGES